MPPGKIIYDKMKMDQRHAVRRYQMDSVLTLQRAVHTAWQGENARERKTAIENCECRAPGGNSQSESGCLSKKDRDK